MQDKIRLNKRNGTHYRFKRLALAAGIGVGLVALPAARGDTYYWDSTATGTWSTATEWWTTPTGTVATVSPGSADTADFNGTGVNGTETVHISGATSVLGMVFGNTGTTTLDSSSTTAQVLSIDAGGITMNGGAVTLGNGTDPMSLALTNSQTWADNTTNTLTVTNAVALAANTLTINGTGTGNVTINGAISSTGAPATSLIYGGLGILTLGGTNTYTGGTIINSGTVSVSAAANLGAAAAPVTINGGILSLSASIGTISSSNHAITIGANGGTINIGSGFTQVITGATGLLGTGTLTKTGAGTMAMETSTDSNFTGSLIINQGIFVQTGGYVNTHITGLTVASGAQFEYEDNGSGSAFMTSSETITLNGDGPTGATPTNDGAILFAQQSGGTTALKDTLNANVTLAGNTRITVTSAGQAFNPVITVAGKISGSAALTKDGDSTLVLSGINSFTGATILSDGTLQLGNSGALPDTNVQFGEFNTALLASSNNAGTLDLHGFSPTIGGLINQGLGTAQIVNNVAGASTLNVNYTGTAPDVFTGAIGVGTTNRNIALTTTGTGTLVLAGNNAYTGATVVSSGTLIAANAAALGATSGLTVSSGAGFQYFASADAPLAVTGALSLGTGTGTTTFGGSIGSTTTSAAVTFSGAGTISGAGVVQVNIFGAPGVTAAAGTNAYTLASDSSGTFVGPTYTLGTVYNASSFTVGTPVATATALTIPITSQTPLANAYWIGGLTGNNNVWAISDGSASSNWAATVGGSSQPLVPGSTTAVTISNSAVITSPVGSVLGANMTLNSLTIADAINGLSLNADGNTLTIAPGSSTSGITMNAGVPASTIAANLALGAPQTWTNNSSNTLTLSGPVTAGNNLLTFSGSGPTTISGASFTTSAGFTVNSGSVSIAAPVTLGAPQTWTNNSSNALAVSGFLNAASNLLTFAGSGATSISGIGLIASGGLTVSSGAVTISAPVALNAPQTWANNSVTPLTVSGLISGSPVLTIAGTGTTILSNAANTYSGGTVVNGGTLQVTAVGNLGPASSPITLENGGTLYIPSGAGLGTIGTNYPISIPAGNTGILNNAVAQNFLGSGLIGPATSTFIKTGVGSSNFGSSGSTFLGTIIINGGEISETSGRLSAIAGMTVNAGGQFAINDNGAATFSFASGSTLTLNGNGPSASNPGAFDEAVQTSPAPTSKFTNNIVLATNSRLAQIVLGAFVPAQILTGAITGPGALIKDGGGTLTLSNAANAWSGGTVISNGTLILGVANALPATTSVQFGESNSVWTTSDNHSGIVDLQGFNQTVAGLTSQGTGIGQIINSVGTTPATLTVNYAGSQADTFPGEIGVGSTNNNIALTTSGTGTLILTNANTYTGGTSVNAGALIAANASALGSGAVTVSQGAGLAYAAAADAPLALASTLAITGGAGTSIGGSIGSTPTSAEISVAGNATATGTVAVNIYGITGVAPATGTNVYTLVQGVGVGTSNTLNGATYTLGTIYNNTSGFTVGAITSDASDVFVSITSANSPIPTAYWTGGLGGATNVWAASSSSASNWLTAASGGASAVVPGATTAVNISASSVATTPVGSTLGANMTINSLTIADTTNGLGLNADGNTLTITPSSSTTGIAMNATVPASYIAANIALGAAQTWTNASANALTISGVVSGSPLLTTTGAGTIILSGGNTNKGGVKISGGVLSLQSAQNTTVSGPLGASGTITFGGGTLQYSSFNNFDYSSRFAATVQPMSIDTNGQNVTFATALMGSTAGSLTLNDTNAVAGTLTLTGSSAYTGGTTVNSGTLTLSGAGALTGTGALSAGIAPASIGVVNFSSTGTSKLGQINLGGSNSSGALNITSGTVTGQNSGTTMLEIGDGGYGSFTVSGGTYNNGSTNSATIRVGDLGGQGVYLQTGGTVNVTRFFVIGGPSTGSAGVATIAGGTLNTNAGFATQLANSAGATGVLNLGTEAGGAGTFVANNAIQLNAVAGVGSSGILNLNAGTLKIASTSGVIAGASSPTSAVLNLNGGTVQAAVAAATLINNTPTAVRVYNGGLTVDTQSNTSTISANLLTTTGNGIYIGGSGGAFAINGGGGSGYIGDPLVTVTDTTTGAALGASAIANITNGAVTGVTLTNPGQGYLPGDVLNFSFSGGGATTAATTFAHTLVSTDIAPNGSGGLTKIGTGTLILTGANTYTGLTSVTAGTLVINGSLPAGTTNTVSVATGGAVLAGGIGTTAGVINGPVTLNGSVSGVGANNGARISAGNGSTTTGTLNLADATANSVNLAAGGSTTYLWKINDPTAGTAGASDGWDKLGLVASGLTIGSGNVVDVVPTAESVMTPINPQNSYRWIIATGVGSGANSAPAVAAQFVLDTTALPTFNTAVGGASASDFSIAQDTGDIVIQYTPAPEPTGMLLLGMGASGLILRRRRKPQ